ncbi:hypothetical protein TruAng_008273 [Truncatella angustata]|nr:hypothetical protein TruAng_008273 [Truncatella angustata]
MANRDEPVPEDWEDVANDNLSVVSLPTSDDEDFVPVRHTGTSPDAGAHTKPRDDKHDEAIASPTVSVSRQLARLSLDDSQEEKAGIPAQQPQQGKINMNTNRLAKVDIAAGSYDSADDETRLADHLDVDLDPNFLQKMSSSTVKLIVEILGIVHFGAHSHDGDDSTDGRTQIGDVCKRLRNHLNDLNPILEGYSKQWTTKHAHVSLPIDPGLYEWMSDLRIELLALQALLQDQMSNRRSDSGPSTFISDLTKYEESLRESCDHMASFLPIIAADFEDFHTANLPVAEEEETTEAEAWEAGDSHHRYSTSGTLSGHAQLRRELYELKDQVLACVECLNNFSDRHPRASGRLLFQLRDSYNSIKSTLDILLSNHASEWIDHGLAGGITYPEFCRLNPDTVRSLNVQLKEIVDNFKMECFRARSFRYTVDPDMVPADDNEEPDDQNIDALGSIQEVLADLFQVKRRPSASTSD